MSEIFLLPGDFYFGQKHRVIKTLLGSCVAITMWNSHLKVGGMCHYKLPFRPARKETQLDGSYGDEAIQLFLLNMQRFMLNAADMEVGLYGAANMFKNIIQEDSKSISLKNIELAKSLLSDLGFEVLHESLGGRMSRKISFDLDSGAVTVESIADVNDTIK